MKENIHRIPANRDELNLYCQLGEALLKIQVAEQALSYSITLKMNPAEIKERADEFLKQHQHTLWARPSKLRLTKNFIVCRYKMN